MNLRYTLLVSAVLAAGACGRQDAAPFVAPDPKAYEKTTGAVKISVLRDTAISRTIPKFVVAGGTTANGQTTVRLYKASDTTFIAGQGLTDANGVILLTGIAPGDYIVRPVLRDSSRYTPTGGFAITVVAADTVEPDTIRVRVSSRITGIIRTDWLDQTRNNNRRHGGVNVYLWRETGNATNVYTVVDTAVTNAVGSYEFLLPAGPERAQIRYNSTEITNFKDTTTLSGNAPVPYVRKAETITISNNTPGRDQFGDAVFQYPTRITGIVYRDRNANGTRDSLPTSNPKEGLIVGDTVQIQLRDSTDARVITTVRVIATSANTTNTTVVTYTFTPNAAPGKYILRLDKLASRFPSNPLEFGAGPAYEVLLAAPTNAVVTAQCRPYVAPPATNTATFGNCNFGLVTGK